MSGLPLPLPSPFPPPAGRGVPAAHRQAGGGKPPPSAVRHTEIHTGLSHAMCPSDCSTRT